MKKKLLLIGGLALSIGLVWNFSNKENDTQKIIKKHSEFLENHPYNKTLALSKKERKARGIPPNKYFEEQYLLEINPNTGRTHPENVFKLQQKLNNQKKLQRTPGDASDNPWTERGPNNVGGRTRVVMFDPNDATHKRVFAGGVSGGLWVNNDITDANSSWTQIGIPENLSVSCITVDPNNSQIMYLGTGESYTGDQAVGNGVWKSTDGGNTWVNVFNDNFNFDVKNRLYYINDIIAWNNTSTNKTEVFIGVAGDYYRESAQWVGINKTGLYKTTDDGANWSKVNLPLIPGRESFTYSSQYEPNDFEISTDNTIWIGSEINAYGYGGGTVLKSIDGTSFTVEHTITNGGRVELAVSKTNKDKLYVLNSTNTTPTMWVTTNSFSSITSITTPADADNSIPNNDFTRGQSFYNLVVEVDPTNDSNVYVGGIDLFRSSNSGGSWTQISKWHSGTSTQQYFYDSNLPIPTVHADQHGWAFHPTDANKAIIGNDGGVFYASSLSDASSSTTAISSRNKGYNVTQFYHGTIGQNTTDEKLLSGSQDNGTQMIDGANVGINPSTHVHGGDGAYSFIDKDGEYIIVNTPYNSTRRINLPLVPINPNIPFYEGVDIQDDDASGLFINPCVLDDNLDILYTNAATGSISSRTGAINRFTNIKGSPTKTVLTNAALTKDATVLKVSPYTTNSTTLFIGTSNRKLLKVQNADTNPVWADIGDPFFVGSISDISFGSSENEILVTFHNYGVKSIWFTSDGGNSWENKEGDFPDIPVKAIMMNPLNNDEVIIGTQLGVWKTSNFKNSAPTWVQSNNGMSNVKVTSFSYRTADNTVLASSFGRGMFTGKFTAAAASVDDVIEGKKSFTVYPTVNNGDFTVFAKNTLGKSRVLIHNIRGQKMYDKNLDFSANERQKVSAKGLQSGVYIVNILGENNKQESRKIIIK